MAYWSKVIIQRSKALSSLEYVFKQGNAWLLNRNLNVSFMIQVTGGNFRTSVLVRFWSLVAKQSGRKSLCPFYHCSWRIYATAICAKRSLESSVGITKILVFAKFSIICSKSPCALEFQSMLSIILSNIIFGSTLTANRKKLLILSFEEKCRVDAYFWMELFLAASTWHPCLASFIRHW